LPNEKVVVFSNGGAALQNTIPERIALEYTDATAPIHFIVVCGSNETFKKYLETKIAPNIPQGAPVKMTVLGFQQRAQMAELAQMADVAIGKPGGMSTMEFIKAGTRVIFDESSYRLRWEKFNAAVMVNSGRATIMNSQSQILDLIGESLKVNRRPPMKMARVRASEKYVSLVSRLLTLANRPAAEQGWKERRKVWHAMNRRMAQSNIW
jgi:UDP-N-acetylglucosamine:LPS N-acetylglucosamine transferase